MQNKIKILKKMSNYYDKMNIRFDEDPFTENDQGISKIYHELLSLMKFLQTKPEVKNMILIITINIILLSKKEMKKKL